jgi:4-amino-4-deoxy-L-arabinose transferase-like glycosyltransferase
MVALHGTLMTYEHSILTEPVFILEFLLAILLVVMAARSDRRWLFVVAGIVIGISALTRPIGQAIALGAPASLLLYYACLRPALIATLLLALGFGLGVGPWVVRNMVINAEATVRSPGSTLLRTVMHERESTAGYFTIGGTDRDLQRAEARKIVERMASSEPDPLEMWTEI